MEQKNKFVDYDNNKNGFQSHEHNAVVVHLNRKLEIYRPKVRFTNTSSYGICLCKNCHKKLGFYVETKLKQSDFQISNLYN